MGVHDGFTKAAGFEQGKAKQHGVANRGPQGFDHVGVHGDGMNQHGVNGHADDNKQRLQAQSDQGSHIVLPDLAPFPVAQGGEGDGRNGRDQVDFHDASIHHHKDADGHDPRNDADQHGLEPQSEQGANFHALQPGFQIGDDRRDIHICIGDDRARRRVDHILRHRKDAHDNIPGMGQQQDPDGCLDRPFHEHEGFKIVEGVFVDHHLNQFIAHHGCEHDPGHGDNDVIRQALDHVEHAAVPALRRRADRTRNIRHLAVDAIEQAVQVIHDAADQNVLDPLHDFV